MTPHKQCSDRAVDFLFSYSWPQSTSVVVRGDSQRRGEKVGEKRFLKKLMNSRFSAYCCRSIQKDFACARTYKLQRGHSN